MKITIGHTPDSDDALMFYGMLTGKVLSPHFSIRHTIGDIEELNRRAMDAELDVTAASVHACAYMRGYTILRSGGSFGIGYGPILTSRGGISMDDLRDARIAIPGRMTSAFLLLQLMIGRFKHTEMRFDEIPGAVRDGRVDAGLVIHETQLSYEDEGNVKVADVGKWWDRTTGGLPVPLGINVIRTDLGTDLIHRFDLYLQESILYGLEHMQDAIDYSMKYSRGKSRDLIERFARMYVNDKTVEMGHTGERSIRTLFQMASERDLIPKVEPSIAARGS